MNSSNQNAKIAGVLFIIATLAFMTGSGLIESIVTLPNWLAGLNQAKVQLISGVFLEFLNSVSVVGIGVLLFPILKQHSEPIALSYLASRVIEAVLLVIGAIAILLLVPLSREFQNIGAADADYFQTLATLAVDWHGLAFQIAMIALGLGSLFLCALLYRARLIPRWLSLLGFVGYVALFASATLEIFGQSMSLILFLPGALFEIIFPIWLIVKGVK